MPYFHFVAKSVPFTQPLVDRQICVDLWERLRRRFPQALACVLMLDHLHLIAEARDERSAEKLKRGIAADLRAMTRKHFPGRRVWAPVPSPKLIADRGKLMTQIRYVHLNPCRKGYVSDPLEWEWSTHRDVMGATARAWVDRAALARIWRVRRSDLNTEFHRYVSSDPSVRIEGTPPLEPVSSAGGWSVPLQDLPRIVHLAARSGALRHTVRGSQERKWVLQLARNLEIRDTRRLCALVDATRQAVHGILKRPLTAMDAEVVAAAHQILADARLMHIPRVLRT